jgi:hypothetical protein
MTVIGIVSGDCVTIGRVWVSMHIVTWCMPAWVIAKLSSGMS